jgi:hypothetical protein
MAPRTQGRDGRLGGAPRTANTGRQPSGLCFPSRRLGASITLFDCGEVVDPLIVEDGKHPPSKPYGTAYDTP